MVQLHLRYDSYNPDEGDEGRRNDRDCCHVTEYNPAFPR